QLVHVEPVACHLMPVFFLEGHGDPLHLHSFPTRRSSDLGTTPAPAPPSSSFPARKRRSPGDDRDEHRLRTGGGAAIRTGRAARRSEEHTSELQSRSDLVCRLLLEKKNGAPVRGSKY